MRNTALIVSMTRSVVFRKSVDSFSHHAPIGGVVLGFEGDERMQ